MPDASETHKFRGVWFFLARYFVRTRVHLATMIFSESWFSVPLNRADFTITLRLQDFFRLLILRPVEDQ